VRDNELPAGNSSQIGPISRARLGPGGATKRRSSGRRGGSGSTFGSTDYFGSGLVTSTGLSDLEKLHADDASALLGSEDRDRKDARRVKILKPESPRVCNDLGEILL
jgi:hypothetical protein